MFAMVEKFENAWLDSGYELRTLKLYWDDSFLYNQLKKTDVDQDFVTIPYLRTLVLSKDLIKWTFIPQKEELDPFKM